jgi:hypothetical protein
MDLFVHVETRPRSKSALTAFEGGYSLSQSPGPCGAIRPVDLSFAQTFIRGASQPGKDDAPILRETPARPPQQVLDEELSEDSLEFMSMCRSLFASAGPQAKPPRIPLDNLVEFSQASEKDDEDDGRISVGWEKPVQATDEGSKLPGEDLLLKLLRESQGE